MQGSFDPEYLTPSASLNRVRIVELPGVAVEPEILGRTAYELLSARVLADLVRGRAQSLGLGDVRDAEPIVLLPQFDRCFGAADERVRQSAERVAGVFGQRLAYLILALRHGDATNRPARPDWDEAYWAHWAAVTKIYLAGGVASGHLGTRLVEHATQTLAQAGMTDCAVRLAPWPGVLPLVGAARTAPPRSRAAIVFDFGHSLVKRAHAQCQDGTLTGLSRLPSLPSLWADPLDHAEPTPEHVRSLGDFMASVMADTWRAVGALGRPGGPTLVASVASYMRDGQPLPRQGGRYAALSTLSDNLARWLSDRVSERLGHCVEVFLLHDGTAAARALAGEAHAAVITLGTALGVGFVPAAGAVHPTAGEFSVLELDEPAK